ncbi:unnamed protein product [Rhizophagus irregularis]|nr:unnamed protein product [Rhizophagus irregularis]
MLFPVPSLKTQIISMYQRPGFVESLQKWTNRVNIADLYTDIYDGEVWKTFPSSLDNPDTQFFTNETADSNFGIMINLNWFQPFNSSAYSSGVIYGVICNLSRDIRFKRENMLYLGLLPGPEEVKLHKINHYLSPIVDELLEFWDGVDLPSTDLHPTANISGRKLNYGGFDDMTEWFMQKDLNEYRRNAERWRLCKSKYERKKYVSETHIVKRLWIDGGKITKTHLKLMEKRAKKIQVPVDLGRIPSKIATGEGFSGYTADQWRSFSRRAGSECRYTPPTSA